MDIEFNVDPSEFQERKRRRISSMATAPPPHRVAPTSAPSIHEIATFLPGRLEFEHETDNDAEDLVKDLEFGICLEWGGDSIMEDEHDPDVKVRARWEEEKKERGREREGSFVPTKSTFNVALNGIKTNGHHGSNGTIKKELPTRSEDQSTDGAAEDEVEENMPPVPLETEESLAFKLTLLEMYSQRVEKRHEAKAIMFDRGLLEYKKVSVLYIVMWHGTEHCSLDPGRR